MRIPPYFPRLGAHALACALALPAQAAERAWSYSYNALGLIERADGPRTDVQDVTLYAYDSRGNLTQVTNALGQVTHLGDYDERGKPGSITDANGVTSSLAYTGVDGWLASVSTAGSTTRFDYDAVGQITRVTRGDGSWLSYEYDDARRLVAIGNNLGERLEYDVDTKGNRTAQRIKDASGSLVRQQQWAYDELGRLLRAVGAGGQTRSFAYDLNDNPVGETNPRQFAHSQAFDALDRLVGQSDPLGGKTQLAYDAQDNLTEVKDPRGVTTRYEYDGLGN
ncbi:RHS repeat protein, partial [Pseudomonas aeruginosa]|nr:RHS repeat protein [Pseudomonas aeruginosa]